MCLVQTCCWRFDLRKGVMALAAAGFCFFLALFAVALAKSAEDNWFEDKGIVLYLPILAISDVMLLCGAIWRLRCPIILWFFPNAVAFLFIIIDLAEDSPSFSHVWVFRSLEIIVLLFYCYTILVVLSYLFKFQSRSGQVLRQGPEQVNLEDPPPPYSPREYEPQTPTAPAI